MELMCEKFEDIKGVIRSRI